MERPAVTEDSRKEFVRAHTAILRRINSLQNRSRRLRKRWEDKENALLRRLEFMKKAFLKREGKIVGEKERLEKEIGDMRRVCPSRDEHGTGGDEGRCKVCGRSWDYRPFVPRYFKMS